MEVWKSIPNFSRYEASNLGNLRSTNYKNSGNIKVLKPAFDKKGYLKTMLQSDNGKYCSWMVHKFITLAFYGEREKDYTVDHIDGNKENNSIDNLEYVTRSVNCKRAVDLGLWEVRHGSKNGNSKLTESDVRDIIELRKTKGRFYGRKDIALKYGISEAHVKDIISGRRDVWKYVRMTL